MRPISLLVVNANDWHNKGDTANRLGLILALRDAFKERPMRLFIETLTPEHDREYFQRFEGVSVYESLFVFEGHRSMSSVFLRSMKNLILFLVVFVIYSVPYCLYHRRADNEAGVVLVGRGDFRRIRNYVRLLYSSDAVISAPGGFIHDDYPIILLINLLPLFLSYVLRKPLIIYNQSIGPFKSSFLAKLAMAVISKAKLITLRETHSNSGFLEGCKYVVTADSAFSTRTYMNDMIQSRSKELDHIEGLHQIQQYRKANSIVVGITLVGYYVVRKKRRSFFRYVDFLGESLSAISHSCKGNVSFVILPQNSNEYEMSFVERIMKTLQERYGIENIILMNQDYTPEEIVLLLNQVDVLIASRLHSAIFASIVAKPIIMLAYQPKFYGIAELLGIDKKGLVFDIFRVSESQVDQFREVVLYAIQHRTELSEDLRQRARALEEKSKMTSIMIRSLVI